MKNTELHSIRLIFADDSMNGVTPIGGAAWTTQEEQLKAWAAIPALAKPHDSSFLAELLDENDEIVDDMHVSAETCARLMGKPIDEFISEGRKKTAYTVEQLFQRNPELRVSFPALSAATPA